MSTPSAVAAVGVGVAAVWPWAAEADGEVPVVPVEVPGDAAGGLVAPEAPPGPDGVTETCEPPELDPAVVEPVNAPAAPFADPEPAATSALFPDPPAPPPGPIPPELAARAPTTMIANTTRAPTAAIAECEIPWDCGAFRDRHAAAAGVEVPASRGMRDWPHSLHQPALSESLAPHASQNWPRDGLGWSWVTTGGVVS